MKKLSLSSLLFMDLECVPQHGSFYDLDEKIQELREKKAKRIMSSSDDPALTTVADYYENRSWIYAEYGKVIVISVWYIATNEDWSHAFRVKSFNDADEKTLLQNFFSMLNNHYYKAHHKFCGHNIKDFDIPYISRRALIHGLELPNILDTDWKKPWEINHVDTMDIRRCGDRRTYISLDLLCRVMGIDTPKNDISGEQVASVYRNDKDLKRITEYCERDIVASAELLLKFQKSDITFTEVTQV